MWTGRALSTRGRAGPPRPAGELRSSGVGTTMIVVALHRVPIRSVDGLDQVEERAAASSGPLVLIFDIDNTVAPQGTPPDRLSEMVGGAVRRFQRHTAVERVIMLTNGAGRGVEDVVSRGNKPWTSRRRLGLVDRNVDVWVVGDQILTDGILAWRLRGEFLYSAIAETGEAPRQAFMRRLGGVVRRLFFVEAAF